MSPPPPALRRLRTPRASAVRSAPGEVPCLAELKPAIPPARPSWPEPGGLPAPCGAVLGVGGGESVPDRPLQMPRIKHPRPGCGTRYPIVSHGDPNPRDNDPRPRLRANRLSTTPIQSLLAAVHKLAALRGRGFAQPRLQAAFMNRRADGKTRVSAEGWAASGERCGQGAWERWAGNARSRPDSRTAPREPRGGA